MKKSLTFLLSLSLVLLFLSGCEKSQLEPVETMMMKESSTPIETLSAAAVGPSSSDCCIKCRATIRLDLPAPTQWDLNVYETCQNGAWGTGNLIASFDENDGLILSIPSITDEHTYWFEALSNTGELHMYVIDRISTNYIEVPDFLPQSLTLNCNNYTTSNCWNNQGRFCCLAVDQ